MGFVFAEHTSCDLIVSGVLGLVGQYIPGIVTEPSTSPANRGIGFSRVGWFDHTTSHRTCDGAVAASPPSQCPEHTGLAEGCSAASHWFRRRPTSSLARNITPQDAARYQQGKLL